jgi:hypothetical protein
MQGIYLLIYFIAVKNICASFETFAFQRLALRLCFSLWLIKTMNNHHFASRDFGLALNS